MTQVSSQCDRGQVTEVNSATDRGQVTPVRDVGDRGQFFWNGPSLSGVSADQPTEVTEVTPIGPIDNRNKTYRDWKFFLPKQGYSFPLWPFDITPKHLRNREAVNELYAIASHPDVGMIDPSDASRLLFFGLAHSRVRKFHKPTDSPGGGMTSALKKWQSDGPKAIVKFINDADEDWASRAIARLSRPSKPTPEIQKAIRDIGQSPTRPPSYLTLEGQAAAESNRHRQLALREKIFPSKAKASAVSAPNLLEEQR